MSSMTARTTYQGHTVSVYDKAFMGSFNKLMRSKSFGGETSDITMLQGGFNRGGVSASAGTHDGGGAMDVTPYNIPNRLKGGRILGNCLNDRPTIRGLWKHHMHGVMDGETSLSAGAKSQVQDHHRDIDGLADRRPETGYQMIVFPQFVEGKLGAYYCKVACHAYEQQTTKSKNLGAIEVGKKLNIIAVTKVGSDLWLVDENGKCVFATNFSMTKPAPGVEVPEQPKPPTPPTAVAKITRRFGNMNVIRWRLGSDPKKGRAPFTKGKDYYPTRCKGFADIREKAGIEIFGTEESGQYIDGQHLSEAVGWGGKRAGAAGVKLEDSSFVLHGDDAGDITQGLHWNPKKVTLIEQGTILTGDAREVAYHNTATYGLLLDSGVYHLDVVNHADYRARGKTSASTYDKNRQEDANVLIAEAEKIAKAATIKYKVKNIPIVYIGDFNQDKDDFYDGIGKAFAAHGYVDCETVATSKSGPDTSFNGMDPKKITGFRPDRIFVKKGTKVGAMVTIAGYPNTDHNIVCVDLTLMNE